MLIKDQANFKIKVNKDFNFFDSISYTVSIFITVDHGKYWENSPNHSEEYTNYINKLDFNKTIKTYKFENLNNAKLFETRIKYFIKNIKC